VEKLLNPNKFLKILLALSVVVTLSLIGFRAEAADKENCLMCHKYKQLGRITEEGQKRSYYVNEHLYANSMHRNIPCRECHTYVTRLPHDPVTEQVNCANECHIKPPFAKENFSHKKIIEVYNKSVHGVKKDDPPDLAEAKPHCKYCHLNPLFTKVDEERVAATTLDRCINCHERKGVTQAYKHITHRLRAKTSRSPEEIVQMCSKNCHADTELMSRLKVSKESLESVETYNESVHGKSVALGSDRAADCVSCHATSAIHDIYKRDEQESTVHTSKRVETCKQCHEKANEQFATIDVHSALEKEEKPILYFVNQQLTVAFYGSVLGLVGLMLVETFGRKKDGIKWQIRHGTTWRGKSKRNFE
jgi:hypothetical protein